ncbi:tetratricopeptide repeat protein [Wenzhouxiangella sp. EGI_FJ10305]|uniref:tetratricopeptide repeat protein n=1 Tax=Wenzhouxiangella sp. EGI_FJ10305 TaxID=3243768 RepID=UPI0035E2415F
MSLINDVLKDLERRDAPEARQTPRPVQNRRSGSTLRSWRWPLWLFAALAVGIVLHLSLNQGGPAVRPQETAPLTAQADPVKEPQAATDPDPSAVSEQPDSATRVEQDASTSPPAQTQQPAPETTVEPVEKQPPQQSAASNGETRTEQPAPASATAPEERSTSEPSPGPDPAPATSQSQAKDEEPTISIRRSNQSPDASDPLVAAKRFLARGQHQRAESRLRELIGEQPGLTEAHELLANTLIRQRRHDSAIRVLETGLDQARDSAPLATLLGRLLMERGELARARSVLAAHAPALSEAPDYHLLLAAAHRQFGDHEVAAALYRELTGILPRRGAAWIGLGASLESLQRQQEAVEAYNQALGGDDARAARFARQRLNALEPITGEME